MQSVDTSAVINYQTPRNVLAASVGFEYLVGSTDVASLTVTDNTDYPEGDSRETIALTVADKFGKKKEYGFSGSSYAVDLTADGFNVVDGIDALITVASTLRIYKDGSVFGIGIGKPSGNFVMEL
jgi:hypothetical protein